MNRLLRITAVAAALVATLALGRPAEAGLRVVETVTIGANYFSGGISAVRYSPDNLQYIGCGLGSGPGGFCQATDAAGHYAVCSFGNQPGLIAAVQAINSTSTLYVQFSGGNCTYISTWSSSVGLQ
jgi:hypothetical protein